MTDGELGECPPWYRILKAAKYLQVPPWELADQPVEWVRRAEAAQAAEAQARATLQSRQNG